MSKLDIKRVKEYMEELGYERDEAIDLVRAEEEEAKNPAGFDLFLRWHYQTDSIHSCYLDPCRSSGS